MPQLNERDIEFIQNYIHWFKEKLTRELRSVISAQVGDTMPPDYHGFAYRHGGDEFVLIIPNMSFGLVIIFLDELRRSILD